SFSLSSDGSFSYTPALNFNGTDSFTYQARDPQGNLSNVATVTITINPINDAPVANNDTYTTAYNNQLQVGAPGVLGNDTDVDTPQNNLTAVPATSNPPPQGTVVLNPDGSFTYTPPANFVGTDSFNYKANDGAADSNVAQVQVT